MHRLLALVGAASLAASGPVGPRPHFIEATLVAESLSPRSGTNVLVGVQMTPKPGWHGYWINPGESGLAPVVKWKAPAGVRFGPLRHPAPTLMHVMGVTSYVHAGPHLLISRAAIDPHLPPGTSLPITAEVSFAACSDKLCVPERATLSLEMIVGDGASSSEASLLRRAADLEPKQGGEGKFDLAGEKVVLEAPAKVKVDVLRARFFPDENGFIDAAQTAARASSPLRIEAPAHGSPPARISGVISDGSAAYRVQFRRAQLSAPPERVKITQQRPADARPARAEPPPDVASAPSRPVAPPERAPYDWRKIAAAILMLSGAIGLTVSARGKRAKRRR